VLSSHRVTARTNNKDERVVFVRVPVDTHEALKAQAEAEDRTISAVVRRAIAATLQDQKESLTDVGKELWDIDHCGFVRWRA